MESVKTHWPCLPDAVTCCAYRTLYEKATTQSLVSLLPCQTRLATPKSATTSPNGTIEAPDVIGTSFMNNCNFMAFGGAILLWQSHTDKSPTLFSIAMQIGESIRAFLLIVA